MSYVVREVDGGTVIEQWDATGPIRIILVKANEYRPQD